MQIIKILYEIKKRLINKFILKRPDFSEKRIFLEGLNNQAIIRKKNQIYNLKDVEYSVFSQFGDDGIIDWIVQKIPSIEKKFIEIGVQDSWESNTRFLLKSENWSGVLIDSSKNDINKIKTQRIYWQHDIKAYQLMVNKDNINNFLTKNLKPSFKNVGLLSIDIDGVDYWILEQLDVIKPTIVVCEYNSLFGNIHKISVLYDENFERTKKHYSNLYFGASIKALISLMEKKGYNFLGTNSAGINAYFLKSDLFPILDSKIEKKTIFQSKVRESLDKKGCLTFNDRIDRIRTIENLKVYDFDEKKEKHLKDYTNLYTGDWLNN